MATLTEMVAAVVVHSSAAALSHFGVAVETPRVERAAPTPIAAPAEQRVVARTPARKVAVHIPARADCPASRKAAALSA